MDVTTAMYSINYLFLYPCYLYVCICRSVRDGLTGVFNAPGFITIIPTTYAPSYIPAASPPSSVQSNYSRSQQQPNKQQSAMKSDRRWYDEDSHRDHEARWRSSTANTRSYVSTYDEEATPSWMDDDTDLNAEFDFADAALDRTADEEMMKRMGIKRVPQKEDSLEGEDAALEEVATSASTNDWGARAVDLEADKRRKCRYIASE